MSYLYHYEKKSRTLTFKIILNVVVLALMHIALAIFDGDSPEVQEILAILTIATPIILGLLLLLAAYFWRKNTSFSIYITKDAFTQDDKILGEYYWSIDPKEIEEIAQLHFKVSNHNRIVVYMKNGNKHYMSVNYNYSRKKIYEAIASLNPVAILPKSQYRFKQV